MCRTRAAPHIKTFARFSNDFTRLRWFLLTSANLSKAAWGCLEKNESQLMIRSYELGVLFLPQFVKASESNTSANNFQLDSSDNRCWEFPVPYDLPPEKYGPKDKPWVYDVNHLELDHLGVSWERP